MPWFYSELDDDLAQYRFTPAQIQSIFSSGLQVRSVSETVYQGTLDPLPRALFCVMQRTT